MPPPRSPRTTSSSAASPRPHRPRPDRGRGPGVLRRHAPRSSASGLIDALLAEPRVYAAGWPQYFDVVLMERRQRRQGAAGRVGGVPASSFAANKPYDAARPRDPVRRRGRPGDPRPAAKFFLDRDLDPQLVTRDIGRLFLGRNIQCAQCHDHPLVEDYKQADYYGIQAFFNRTFLFPNAQAPTAVIAEKADGEVNFTSVFDKSQEAEDDRPAGARRKPVAEPKVEKGKEYKVAPAKDVQAGAGVQPVRAQLAGGGRRRATTRPFARTAANRLWAMLHGPRARPPGRPGPLRQPAVAPRAARPAGRRVRGPQVRREVAAPRDRPDRRPTSGRARRPPGARTLGPDRYRGRPAQAAVAGAAGLRSRCRRPGSPTPSGWPWRRSRPTRP